MWYLSADDLETEMASRFPFVLCLAIAAGLMLPVASGRSTAALVGTYSAQAKLHALLAQTPKDYVEPTSVVVSRGSGPNGFNLKFSASIEGVMYTCSIAAHLQSAGVAAIRVGDKCVAAGA